MLIEQMEVGQILQSWHDTGAMGPQPVYYRVLKIARVKVRVRSEYGAEGWMYPAAFTKAMRPEDVNWIEWK